MSKIRLKKWVKITLGVIGGLTAISLIALGSRVIAPQSGVVVKWQDADSLRFMDESDVMAVVQTEQNGVIGQTWDLKKIEQKVMESPFVADCQVAKDLRGNLIVNVTQCRPIARILRNGTTLQGGYLTEKGSIMPLSKKFTPRCLVISGQTEKLFEKEYFGNDKGKNLISFLEFVQKDEFWRVQITQLDLDKNGNMVLIPQAGNQEILFGTAEDYEQKLHKLGIFYEKIAPAKGWKTYKTVNLKFKDQIVCK